MTKTKQVLSAIGILAVVVAITAVFTAKIVAPKQLTSEVAGAAGNMLAEDYDPYVRYNGGYNSALDIVTSADLETSGTFTMSGTATISGATALTSTFQLGSAGTAQTSQIVTTCAPKADVSITATSTGYMTCTGLTGITTSHRIFASFATSTSVLSPANNWVIVSAISSTTGTVDIGVLNLTGGTAVPSAASQIASSTRIWAVY